MNMQKENMEQAKSGGGMPRGELLPYRAPWIEMNVVKLEGDIVASSANVRVQSGSEWQVNRYQSEESQSLGDITLF
jgi:hypothetical protein